MAVVPSTSNAQSVSQGGSYQYNNGSYESTIANNPVTTAVIDVPLGVASSAAIEVIEAQQFLNRNLSFGAWRTSNSTYAAGTGGLGLQLTSPFVAPNSGFRQPAPPDQYAGFKFGPFFIDEIYAGAGAMYSDYQGVPIFGNLSDPPGEDNWAGIVWAQARLTAYITDRFAIAMTPSVYWLPLKNDVGWGLVSPFLGMGAFGGPYSLLEAGFKTHLAGNFEFTFHEQFRAVHPGTSLLRDNPFYWANLGDTTPVDFAGRYQFGGWGGAHQIDSRGSDNFSINDDPFDQDNMFFFNMASANLRGQHGDHVSSQLYYNRQDYWDDNFDNHQAWHSIGAVIMKDGPVLSPYAMYEMNAADHFKTHYQYAVVGANWKIGPSLLGYAQSGWLWSDTERNGSRDSWIGLVGLRHRLGPHTFHGFDAGKAPTDSFRSRYVSTYAQYYVQQRIGPKAMLRAFAQQAELESLDDKTRSSADRSAYSFGVMAELAISSRSTLNMTAAYENVDMTGFNRGYELWTYRVLYNHQIGRSTNGICYYQYQESGSAVQAIDDFAEHLLFLGLSKHF